MKNIRTFDVSYRCTNTVTDTYGVWIGDFDNDAADYFESYNSAFDAWHEAAEAAEDGDTVYMAKFDDDGDIVEGTQRELRVNNGDINEYDENGTLLWL